MVFYTGKHNSREQRQAEFKFHREDQSWLKQLEGITSLTEWVLSTMSSVQSISNWKKLPYFHNLDSKEKLFFLKKDKDRNIDLTFLGFDNYLLHYHLQWQLKYTGRYTTKVSLHHLSFSLYILEEGERERGQ